MWIFFEASTGVSILDKTGKPAMKGSKV